MVEELVVNFSGTRGGASYSLAPPRWSYFWARRTISGGHAWRFGHAWYFFTAASIFAAAACGVVLPLQTPD